MGGKKISQRNAAQRRQAGINLAELRTRANCINVEIDNKRMEKIYKGTSSQLD